METKIQKYAFDSFILETVSDVHQGKILDTIIKVYPRGKPAGETYLTTIAGVDIGQFIGKLSELINKYKI